MNLNDHARRVIASVKKNEQLWADARKLATNMAGPTFIDRWHDVQRHHAANAEKMNNINDVRDIVSTAILNSSAWSNADDAVIALAIWEDCAYMLDSDPGELAIIAMLGNDCATMLLPACIVFAKEKALNV